MILNILQQTFYYNKLKLSASNTNLFMTYIGKLDHQW